MRPRPTAVGYLRRDVSGISQDWNEIQIRSVAQRLGYDLAKTVVFGRETDDPEGRLLNVIRAMDVDAVIVPNAVHLGGAIPDALVQECDVVTVSPENTYARWPVPLRGLRVDGG
ncbi:hypothetical protein ACFQZZ_25845 [Nocardia sp. GCM10030253]|uniref:hypothetical protein n=1 Tax=Nocardia sp. GCM10030253 TaxID=3273404 RepID=UPI0036416BA1